MTWSQLPLKPTARVLRQFAAAWLVAFLLLTWRRSSAHGNEAIVWALGAMALPGLVGLLKPQSIRWLFIAATIAAFPIGWLVSQIILLVMFYLVLTPVALLFRWRGRDVLRLRKPPQGSLWISREAPPEAGRYLKQF